MTLLGIRSHSPTSTSGGRPLRAATAACEAAVRPATAPAASGPWSIRGKLRLDGVVRKEGCESTPIVEFDPRPGSVGPEGTPSGPGEPVWDHSDSPIAVWPAWSASVK